MLYLSNRFIDIFPMILNANGLPCAAFRNGNVPQKKPQHFGQGNGIGHKIPENYMTKVVIKFDKIHRFARLFYGPATI